MKPGDMIRWRHNGMLGVGVSYASSLKVHCRCLMSDGHIDYISENNSGVEVMEGAGKQVRVICVGNIFLSALDGLMGTTLRPGRCEREVIVWFDAIGRGMEVAVDKRFLKELDPCTCSMEQVYQGCICGHFKEVA